MIKEKIKYVIIWLTCFFLFAAPFYIIKSIIFLGISLLSTPKLIKIIKNLPAITANVLVKFIDKIFIEKDKQDFKKDKKEYKYTKRFIYAFFVMFFIAFFHDFESDTINKSKLDTIIVVFSLLSLILGRIFEIYSSQNFYSYISFCLKHCARSILLWLPVSLVANCIFFKICINSYSYQSWLEVIILLVSSFILLILSELAKIKNREKLLFAFWWIFILILYLIKMRTSK